MSSVLRHARRWLRSVLLAGRRWARRACLRLCPLFFLRRCGPSGAEVGLAGERLAARHLSGLGWSIVGARLRTPAGEVDLVARDGGTLVAVEVKTGCRRYRARGPGRRLGARRRQRLRRAAAWLGARQRRPARADLVEVIYGGRGAPEICHERDLQSALSKRSSCAFLYLDGDGPLALG